MRVPDLLTWVFDTTTDVLADTDVVSLSNPSAHVDIADAHDEATYPFVGVVPITLTSVSGGLGNETLTTVATTESGDTVEPTEMLRREFTLEVTPVTNDDPQLRDQLTETLTLGFASRIKYDDVPDDLTLSVGETTPSDRAESFVRANGVELNGELTTLTTNVLPATKTVSWGVTSDGQTVPSDDVL